MNIVLFNEEEIIKPLSINDERAQHILKILHKKENDTFESGLINQQAGISTITKITNSEIFFNFTPLSDGKPLYPLSMIIGFPRPIQLKRMFRDLASLGVEKIYLTGTELGEKSYMQSSLVDKDKAINFLEDGSIQAKSTHIPDLVYYNKLEDNLRNLQLNENTLLIALDNIRPKSSLNNFLNKNLKNNFNVIAAIGSERGWTDKERELLEKYHFTLCGMGQRVLRTETAATVAASVILSNMGVLE